MKRQLGAIPFWNAIKNFSKMLTFSYLLWIFKFEKNNKPSQQQQHQQPSVIKLSLLDFMNYFGK